MQVQMKWMIYSMAARSKSVQQIAMTKRQNYSGNTLLLVELWFHNFNWISEPQLPDRRQTFSKKLQIPNKSSRIKRRINWAIRAVHFDLARTRSNPSKILQLREIETAFTVLTQIRWPRSWRKSNRCSKVLSMDFGTTKFITCEISFFIGLNRFWSTLERLRIVLKALTMNRSSLVNRRLPRPEMWLTHISIIKLKKNTGWTIDWFNKSLQQQQLQNKKKPRLRKRGKVTRTSRNLVLILKCM